MIPRGRTSMQQEIWGKVAKSESCNASLKLLDAHA